MKTYLVTGGLGFIGSNYILYMFKKYNNDIKIINVDCITYAGNPENLKSIENNKNYVFKKADICDGDIIGKIFEENEIDYIIHFAAESHVDRSIKSPGVFVSTNIMGTFVLLNAAKKYWMKENSFDDGKKYVQISTDEVYGSLSDTGYFTETTPLSPNSPYSASKASADLLVHSYFHTYNIPVNITRCSNNYGPYQFPEKLIPLIIHNALSNKPLPVYGDGKNIRDWLYVEDHARAIDLVTKKGVAGEVYNIGGHNEKQNIEIVNTIIDLLNELLPSTDERRNGITKDLIQYVTDRLGHDRRYAIDASKIKEHLGWEPSVMFDEGIKKTIRWYLDNEQWVSNVTNGQYQNYYKEMYNS